MSGELAVLQTARFKGRLAPEVAAAACGVTREAAEALLASACAAGHLREDGKLTPAGRARLTELLAAERASLADGALAEHYRGFAPHNAELKAIVSAWQLRDGAPNDHADDAYDRAVIARLECLHGEFAPWLATATTLAPRLTPYPDRFAAALHRIRAGESTYVARPIADSYHTVWFELHEDLVGMLGHDRCVEDAT